MMPNLKVGAIGDFTNQISDKFSVLQSFAMCIYVLNKLEIDFV